MHYSSLNKASLIYQKNYRSQKHWELVANVLSRRWKLLEQSFANTNMTCHEKRYFRPSCLRKGTLRHKQRVKIQISQWSHIFWLGTMLYVVILLSYQYICKPDQTVLSFQYRWVILKQTWLDCTNAEADLGLHCTYTTISHGTPQICVSQQASSHKDYINI